MIYNMKDILKRPLLIYDEDCTFCRRWILYWQKLTQNRVTYAPYQQVAQYFPKVSKTEFKESVKFVDRKVP